MTDGNPPCPLPLKQWGLRRVSIGQPAGGYRVLPDLAQPPAAFQPWVFFRLAAPQHWLDVHHRVSVILGGQRAGDFGTTRDGLFYQAAPEWLWRARQVTFW